MSGSSGKPDYDVICVNTSVPSYPAAYEICSWSHPTGRHFCLKCTATSAISKIAPKDQQPDTVPVIRTLDSMSKDLADLQKADGDITKANLFNNIIAEYLLKINI